MDASNSNNNREQTSFFHFSDQLRLHTTNLANISIGDATWSAGVAPAAAALPSDLVVNGWKTSFVTNQKLPFNDINTNTTANRYNNNNNFNRNDVNYNNNKKSIDDKLNNDFIAVKNYYNLTNNYNIYFDKAIGKKNSTIVNDGVGRRKNYNLNSNPIANPSSPAEKKYKTLPASESLPRNESIGGYIFVCNNDTMEENLRRELFGLPPRYRDSVRAITPGLPIFLYNYSTHQLHGIFEAASFGGTNIDPTAWEDKKCPGSSRFPSQVRVVTRKIFDPLEEDAFRPILHHYDGPKFRLELNIEETLKLLDVFVENNA